jgi:hypothetical protein
MFAHVGGGGGKTSAPFAISGKESAPFWEILDFFQDFFNFFVDFSKFYFKVTQIQGVLEFLRGYRSPKIKIFSILGKESAPVPGKKSAPT